MVKRQAGRGRANNRRSRKERIHTPKLMNKASRVAALVRLLATERGLTLIELGRALHVSRRTVYRYLRDVVEAGFRIASGNGYHLEPVEGSGSTMATGTGKISLQDAVDRLISHPAIRNDRRLVATLREVASLAPRRPSHRRRSLSRTPRR